MPKCAASGYVLSCGMETLHGQAQQQALQHSWAMSPCLQSFSFTPCQHLPC